MSFTDEEIIAAALAEGIDAGAALSPQGDHNHKTPWNPSSKAIKRVKDPLPVPHICRYCNGTVRIVNHTAIYFGRTYGDWPWVYRCEDCHARVGMHPFTNLPLGTLANAELIKVRKECKQPFEVLWQERIMGRTEAYAWLAEAMGKSVAHCHFGLFEVEECRRAKDLSVQRLQSGKAPNSAMANAFARARK